MNRQDLAGTWHWGSAPTRSAALFSPSCPPPPPAPPQRHTRPASGHTRPASGHTRFVLSTRLSSDYYQCSVTSTWYLDLIVLTVVFLGLQSWSIDSNLWRKFSSLIPMHSFFLKNSFSFFLRGSYRVYVEVLLVCCIYHFATTIFILKNIFFLFFMVCSCLLF